MKKTLETSFSSLCLTGIVFTCALFSYYLYCNQISWSWSWDMDATVVIDQILINSDKLPGHFAHPGVGIQAVGQLAERGVNIFSDSSRVNFQYLANEYTNPAIAVVELSEFLRFLNPFVVFLIPLLLSLSCLIYFSGQYRLFFAASAIFASLPPLQFYVFTTRSESFAALFWSLSVFFLVASTKMKRTASYTLQMLSGLFLGLAFITKVQIIFYILATVIVYVMYLLTRQYRNPPKAYSYKNLVFSFLPIVGLFYLSWYAMYCNLNAYATFRSTYSYFAPQMIFTFLLFLLPFLSAILIHPTLRLPRTLRGRISQASLPISFFTSGWFISCFIPIALYPLQSENGIKHVLIAFKVAYLGLISDSVKNAEALSGNILGRIAENIGVFYPTYLLVLLFGFILWSKTKPQHRKAFATVTLCLAGIQISFLSYGIRPMSNKDQIWTVLLPAVVLIAFAGFICKSSKASNKSLSLAPLLLVGLYVLSLYNIDKAEISSSSLTTDYSFYENVRNREVRFFQKIYPGTHDDYDSFFHKLFPTKETLDSAVLQARNNHRMNKKIFSIDSNFQKHSGFIEKGLRTSPNNGEEQFFDFSDVLKNKNFWLIPDGIVASHPSDILDFANSLSGWIFRTNDEPLSTIANKSWFIHTKNKENQMTWARVHRHRWLDEIKNNKKSTRYMLVY